MNLSQSTHHIKIQTSFHINLRDLQDFKKAYKKVYNIFCGIAKLSGVSVGSNFFKRNLQRAFGKKYTINQNKGNKITTIKFTKDGPFIFRPSFKQPSRQLIGEAAVRRCSAKYMLLKLCKIQMKIALPEPWRPRTCNFAGKKTLSQVFSCDFCKIAKNIFLQKKSGLLLTLNQFPKINVKKQ